MTSPPFRLARLPSPPAPLPCVPGPKLAPFTPTAQANIEFIEFLGRENDKDSLVWKVKINKAGPFALKMFYFFNWKFLRDNQGGDLIRPLAHPQLYIDYFDPFNCECRAYGRLKEENREDLAVKAHGYLLLTPQQEAGLAQRVEGSSIPPPDANTGNLNGPNFWNRTEQHRGLPVRAIVKDLAAGTCPTPAQTQGMWADLQALHSLGIFVMDIHSGNYLAGKIVDFSRSWTMYHPAMDQVLFSTIQDLLLSELQRLVDNFCEAASFSPAGTITIPQDLEDLCLGGLNQYKNPPWVYNWLKWERDANVANAYVKQRLFKKAAP